MTAASIVKALRDSGVDLNFRGSKITTLGRVPPHLAGLIKQNREEIHECLRAEAEEQGSPRWCTICSELLRGETFLLVMSDKHLEAATKAHPNMVVYLLREALDLIDRGVSDDTIRAVHRVKQKLGGHVVTPA